MSTPGLTDPSPNFGPRRGGAAPHLIVLHYTAMDSVEAALKRLRDPASEVSAHYLIAADGRVASLVPEDMRAWHAGAGCWAGCTDVNSASLGIELDNDGCSPFGGLQIAALERLLDDIMARWRIPPQGVIGHQDMAPGRKSDPGPHCPWKRLADGGRSVWPDIPDPAEIEGGPVDGTHWSAFLAGLRRFGYPQDDQFAGISDEALFDAFRARIRPNAGPFDQLDLSMTRDLEMRFRIDRPIVSS